MTVPVVALPFRISTWPLWRLVLLAAAVGFVVGLAAPEARRWLALVPFVIATAIDVRERRIPNRLTMPAIAFALVSVLFAGGLGGLAHALAGLFVAGGVGLVVAVAARGGFGMGDVKLMAYAGAAVGMARVLPFLVTMSLAGGVFAIAVMVAGRRHTPIPYGPAIAFGGVAVLLLRG